MKLKFAVLLMTAALAVPAVAQTSSTSTSGVVVSSTSESLIVRMDDGTQRTFNVTSTTTLPSMRLAEGNRVTVQYRPLDAGLFEAARVELAAALTSDRPTANPTPDRSMTTDTTTRDRQTPTTTDRSMMSEPARIQGGVTAAQPETTTPRDTSATSSAANNDREETLPATASPMPLLALSGLAALVAGLVMKARRTA